MTRWYAYRWVCDNCRAIHYYEVSVCCRCGCKNLTRLVNNKRLAAELESGKRPRKTYGPANVERELDHNPRNLKQPIHQPEEEDDAELGTSDGKTVQPEDSDLDHMINDILEG